MRPIVPVFYKRDFSAPLVFPDVKLIPDTYSHAAQGGPDKARVSAFGQENAVWEMLEWLRAPVEFQDWRAERVWWGYLSGITVKIGAIELGLTLDAMSNRLAIAYTGQGGMQGRQTTAWAQDNQSVTAYGTKELLESLSNASLESAENFRDALLEELRYPVPKIEIRAAGQLSAVLDFRGWFDTLGWQYYAQPAGEVGNIEIGQGLQSFGNAAGSEKLAQSFQIDTAWSASMLAVNIKTEGAPADNVIAEICADSAGAPGSVLGTATIPAAGISMYVNWTWADLAAAVSLAAAATYWLVLRRSGSLDAVNFYKWNVNEELSYPDGVFRVYNGSSWIARTPDADANFQIAGVQETTAQIEAMATAAGQFLTGVRIEDASEVSSPQYRDGDTTAMTEIMALLKNGTSNGRRLLAQVNADRVLRVYEEPAYDAYTPDYFINGKGKLSDKWNNRILDHTCPVAGWCQLRDIIPPTLDVSKMADASRFFIERSEYRVSSMGLSVEPRSLRSVWDVGGMGGG